MASKKAKKYVCYISNQDYDNFVGTLAQCEDMAADWFKEGYHTNDIIIGEIVPVKSLSMSPKPSALPWKKLSDGCKGG